MTKVSLNVFRISAIDDRNLHEIVIAYFRALFERKKHGSLSFERFNRPSTRSGTTFNIFLFLARYLRRLFSPYLICRSWTICG